MGGGFAFGSAFDSRSGQMIMVALVLMIGSFYAGTLFGNNAPAYVSQPSNSSSSPGSVVLIVDLMIQILINAYFSFSVPLLHSPVRLGDVITNETDGILLKEVDHLLRPNGYFVYLAPPAYRKYKDYPVIWDKLVNYTTAMSWKLIARKVQTAIWIKQENEASCLQQNAGLKQITICESVNDSKPSWNIPLRNCIQSPSEYSRKSPSRSDRLSIYSKSLNRIGVSEEERTSDTIFWQDQVHQYWKLMSIHETEIRNVMDMNAFVGGLAVALNEFPVWVMNIVPESMNNTLTAIYDRGLLGAFHDWCEPFSTYPRTYDLLHADHLFSHYKNRGKVAYWRISCWKWIALYGTSKELEKKGTSFQLLLHFDI
ncbi:hypothetical protein HS088_TW03G00598 [Tripterygium wilfordii]|uniref:Methyltransferase n=1 Tax=Tripterygium wilfordii TaxID=458696 RepID=A0A7J7DVS8_TRIWF|nr:hypothetical protein HS088_TW03G00598 [Tripterygium wilfordii]